MYHRRCPLTCEVLYVIARHCPLWGPQKILCTFGEKAQTRKRVSVIVPDNVISKAQFAPHRPEGNHIIKPTQDTFVPVGKIGDPKRYFRTFGEKEYASIRQAIVACDD